MKYKVGDRVKINAKTDHPWHTYNKDIEEILQKINRILTITEVVSNVVGNDNALGPGYQVKEIGSQYRWYDKDIKCLVKPDEPENYEPPLKRWEILDIRE